MSEERGGDASQDQSATMTVRDAIALAMKKVQVGQFEQASQVFRAILAAFPEEVDALHFLGLAEYQLGRTQVALENLDKAVALAPAHADLLNNRGNVLRVLGRLEEAEADYRRVLALRPDDAAGLSNLGSLARARGDFEGAIVTLKKVTTLDPSHPPAWQNLGNALLCVDRNEEALAAFAEAGRLMPESSSFFLHTGLALYKLGRIKEAAEAYRKCLKIAPDHPQAAHLLAACTGGSLPTRASPDYVRAEFDTFAASFDAVLGLVNYRGPALIDEAVGGIYGDAHPRLTVLDAGCGTGLCGPVLRPRALSLVGVDLSPAMVALARNRAVYDQLVVEDLVEHLRQHPTGYDLIVSADTLIYFGDLSDALNAAFRSLRSAGALVCTLERFEAKDAPTGYCLNPHGRYSHTRAYVMDTLVNAGFVDGQIREADIRTEAKQWVRGLVVTARVAPAT